MTFSTGNTPWNGPWMIHMIRNRMIKHSDVKFRINLPHSDTQNKRPCSESWREFLGHNSPAQVCTTSWLIYHWGTCSYPLGPSNEAPVPLECVGSVRWSKVLLSVLCCMWGAWVARKVKMLWKTLLWRKQWGHNLLMQGEIGAVSSLYFALTRYTVLYVLVKVHVNWYISECFHRLLCSNVKKTPTNFIRSAINS